MLDTQIRQEHTVFTLIDLIQFRPLTVCYFSDLPGREQKLYYLSPVSLAFMICFYEELLYLIMLQRAAFSSEKKSTILGCLVCPMVFLIQHEGKYGQRGRQVCTINHQKTLYCAT